MHDNTPPHPANEFEDEFGHGEDGDFLYFDDFEEITEAELDSLPTIENDDPDFDDDQNEMEPRVPLVDNSIVTFSNHTAPVFSCSLHPTKQWAATGGEDDKAYIWDRQTGDIVYEVKNHQDTLISVQFSYDGNYWVTGDMSGEIQVFKLNGDIKKIWNYTMGDMTWLKWHRAASILMAGSESGEIYVWRIPSGDCKILPGKGSKCETAELTADGKKLFAGYGDGVVKLWDIKNSNSVFEIDSTNPLGHTEGVFSVSCDSDNSLYASCGDDCKVLLTSNNGVIGAISVRTPLEVVAIAPYPDLKVVATGTVFNELCIWDIGRQALRARCEHSEGDGVTSMKWLPNYTLLVGTISGSMFGYDGRNGFPMFKLTGHAAQIYDLCVNTNENIVLTASEDGTAKIFKYP